MNNSPAIHYWCAAWSAVITVSICAIASVAGEPPPFHSNAPYADEAAAIAEGQRRGIGTIELAGATTDQPTTVIVNSFNTFTLRYTVGTAGLKKGGGIRIGLRHLTCWSRPQTLDPAAPGYVTVAASNAAKTRVYIEYNNFRGRLFNRYHPWQNMIEVIVTDRDLASGETITVTLGDRGGGSNGIRVQPFDESAFVFKTFVDVVGNDDYLPLGDCPVISIVPDNACRLSVVVPSDAVTGTPTWALVRAEDLFGNPADRFRGEIVLEGDALSDGPQRYSFTAADSGVHRFENITLNGNDDGNGTARLTARCISASHEPRPSPAGAAISGDGVTLPPATSNPIRFHAKTPPLQTLWGDLHGHSGLSDGLGTPEAFYDFAQRVAALDVAALTDHAFLMSDESWAHSRRATNAANQPGRFVTFQAYEWSGMSEVGGDHNVFFVDDHPPLARARSYYDYRNLRMYHGPLPQVNHIEDLFATLAPQLRNKNVFCIPHYGGRRGNDAFHNSALQRGIEVYSEHRRSEDWMTPFLISGYRLGVIASSDDHFGNPGYGYIRPGDDWSRQEIGMGLVAIRAASRTRESVFEAIYERRVYATTGDRILLDVTVNNTPMGGECVSDAAPHIRIDVTGTADISLVEIKRDSTVVHRFEPARNAAVFEWRDDEFTADQEHYYYVRVVQANGEEAISSPVWVNVGKPRAYARPLREDDPSPRRPAPAFVALPDDGALSWNDLAPGGAARVIDLRWFSGSRDGVVNRTAYELVLAWKDCSATGPRVALAAGRYRITMTVRGEGCPDDLPRLQVRLGDSATSSFVDIVPDTSREYRVDFALERDGEVQPLIHFVNDGPCTAGDKTRDKNAFVEFMTIERLPVAAAP